MHAAASTHRDPGDSPPRDPTRNGRQTVYFDAGGYRTYLGRLARNVLEAGVRALGYCLMGNHVHLIVVTPDEPALARV